MSALYDKAREASLQYELICQGDRIAAGVSGGADSVALLAFLVSVQQEWGLSLTVCHLNHCLRGAESDRDEAFVRELARSFGLPLRVQRTDVTALARELGCSLEEAGRRARYRFFEEAAGECGKIATAHTLGDNMETILLNLTRGTGLRGLCGIPRRRGNIIRPLLSCSREEILDYLAEQGLSHVEDSTNGEDSYTRNRLRHRVIPELLRINPAAGAAMERTARQLTAQWEMTEALADRAEKELALPSGGISRRGLLALPEPVGDRLLLRMLERAGLPLSAGTVCEMRRTAEQGGVLDVGERRWYFRASGEAVSLRKKSSSPPPAPVLLQLPAPGTFREVPLGDRKRFRVTLCCNLGGKDAEILHNCPLKNQVNCDKIVGNIIIRTRWPQDRLRLPGREGSRPLSKWYTEFGVPQEERARAPVLTDDEGVIWAWPMGAAERVRASGEDRNILIAEVLEERDHYENG